VLIPALNAASPLRKLPLAARDKNFFKGLLAAPPMRYCARLPRQKPRSIVMKRPVCPWIPITRCVAALTLVLTVGSASAQNSLPSIDDPLKLSDETKKVEPKVPIGKTLIIPITAQDADGHALSYKVTSSNPAVMVRARTGRPHVKINVDYEGDATAEPPSESFTGTLEFQIFRDWTPETAGYIAGFAQSLFYSPRVDGNTTLHTIFHRVIKDFMCQTGDPNSQLPDPGPPAAPLSRGPGFSFDDELGVPMIFTGRGQLAMANAGYTSNFKGSNGSQFFITTGSPRHLDFNHTIFGQIVRGWDILEKMQNVPVKEQTPGGEVSRPTKDIKITGTSVSPSPTDAVLVISAIGKATSTIKVTVTDPEGGKAEREFQVEAVVDDRNSPPFFRKNISDTAIAKNKPATFTFQTQDLEHDHLTYVAEVTEGGANSEATLAGTQIKLTPRGGYVGPLRLAYALRQYDMGSLFGRSFDEIRSVKLAVGDKSLRVRPLPVFGQPGVAITSAPLGSFVDTDPRGQGSNATVSINWGDGTPSSSGVLSLDRDRPTVTAYRVNGSHVYARAGIYPVVITLTSQLGLSEVIRSVAVITDKAVRLLPEEGTVAAREVSGRRLAKIVDATPGKPSDYEATIDWGDGDVTAGVIKRTGAGELYVTGDHTYGDPDTYSVAIDVRRKGGDSSQAASTWATIAAKFPVKESYLPPFPMSHLIAGLSSVMQTPEVAKPFVSSIGSGANKTTVLTFNLGILNSGNKKSSPSKIRFYLSTDRVLNLEQETYTDDTVDPPVQRNRPKDVQLDIGKSQKEISLIPLKPGQGGNIAFDDTATGDMRVQLPKGESGAGYHLLAALVYDDPLAKLSPIAREEIREILPPFSPAPAGLEMTETAGAMHTRTFDVVFERRPNFPVTVPLSIISPGSGEADTTELYFNAVPPVPPADNPGLPSDENLVSSPDHSVTLTPEMWDAGTKKITVQVTGKQDSIRDGDQQVAVRLGPSVSNDARFHAKLGPSLSVVMRDRDSLIVVSPTSQVTTEATGNAHSRTFTIRLSKKPTANVILPVVNNDPSEGVVTAADVAGGPALTEINGKPSLTFTTAETYPATRTLTITAVDDLTLDGTVVYTIAIGPSTSTDLEFNGIKPPDVTVTNLDNPPPPAPPEAGDGGTNP
jgi:cyclophilin family peptidyl-prolyl cis-trans isomerase